MPDDDTPLPALPEDWGRALAVVAHPDDMEYGMSAAVARWTAQGKQVSYLLATRGEAGIDTLDPQRCAEVREREERAACDAVGVGTLEYLDHPDGTIHDVLRLRRDIARAVRVHRPDVVLTTTHHEFFAGGAFNMADHRVVGLAVLDAVRDAANRWVFPDLADDDGAVLDPWPGVRFVAMNGSDRVTHAVDVTDTLEQGVASLRAHSSYLAALDWHPDPDDLLREVTSALAPRFGGCAAVGLEAVGLTEE